MGEAGRLAIGVRYAATGRPFYVLCVLPVYFYVRPVAGGRPAKVKKRPAESLFRVRISRQCYETYSPILAGGGVANWIGVRYPHFSRARRITVIWAVILAQFGSTGRIEVKKGLIYLVRTPNRGLERFFPKIRA